MLFINKFQNKTSHNFIFLKKTNYIFLKKKNKKKNGDAFKTTVAI